MFSERYVSITLSPFHRRRSGCCAAYRFCARSEKLIILDRFIRFFLLTTVFKEPFIFSDQFDLHAQCF